MEESPADRIVARKNSRMPSLPSIHVPREGAPALEIGKRRAANRIVIERRPINTPITPRHYELVYKITDHFKAEHGRNNWKMNRTLELAIDDLAQKLGIEP